MIYEQINQYNSNLIINYLNDSFNLKTYTLFKSLDYKETHDEDTDNAIKTITIAIDGRFAYLEFIDDNTMKLRYENTYQNEIFRKIDMDLLRNFLITHFRDKTIEKIIENA